jgi:ABC-type transport system involved in multi-copper enzyme maturation permease subunit
MKSICWKEWRESRAVIPFSVILMAVLFVGAISLERYSLAQQERQLQLVSWDTFEGIVLVFWCIPAALCSASMVSNEIGSGTLQFLSSIPISRNRIWWAKLATGLAVLTLSAIASAAIFAAMYQAAFVLGFLRDSFAIAINDLSVPTIVGILVALGIFAVGTLATVITERMITTLVTVVVLTVCCGLAVLVLSNVFGRGTTLASLVQICLFVVAGFVCLTFSNRIFVKGESLKWPQRFSAVWNSRILEFLAVIAALVISYLWIIR